MSGSQETETSIGDLPHFYPPTGDKEDFEITHKEFEQIKEAFKDEKFRKLLTDYVDEVQDPENQKTYQSEVRQLELQNGNVVHFLNPIPGYVLKTSVDGHKKGFINICANPLIRKASAEKSTKDSKNGCMWSIPYAQSPVREDVDKAGAFCQVYDVILNPDILHLANQNAQFRNKIEQTALDAVENSFKVVLDRNNVKKPKLQYKGMPRATMIKYKIGHEPPSVVDPEAISNEIPPQKFKNELSNNEQGTTKETTGNGKKNFTKPGPDYKPMSKIEKKLSMSDTPADDQECTSPRYAFKYRNHVDLQDCCLDNQRSGASSKPIPDEIILTIDLPLLSDSSTLDADVLEDGWTFELRSERKAFYELKLKLPFKVQCESSKATFDKDKRKLQVIMKTQTEQVKRKTEPDMRSDSSNDADADVFDETHTTESPKKLLDQVGDTDVGYESTESAENIPSVLNGNVVVKSILKGSNNRCRSMSESWVEHIDHMHNKEEFMSLDSLSESNEKLTMSESSTEKSVRFSDQVQRQLYRSNSSILGQRKKNQRKNKSKRKNRERHSSEGSVSSFDDEFGREDDTGDNNEEKSTDMALLQPNKHKKKPCDIAN